MCLPLPLRLHRGPPRARIAPLQAPLTSTWAVLCSFPHLSRADRTMLHSSPSAACPLSLPIVTKTPKASTRPSRPRRSTTAALPSATGSPTILIHPRLLSCTSPSARQLQGLPGPWSSPGCQVFPIPTISPAATMTLMPVPWACGSITSLGSLSCKPRLNE